MSKSGGSMAWMTRYPRPFMFEWKWRLSTIPSIWSTISHFEWLHTKSSYIEWLKDDLKRVWLLYPKWSIQNFSTDLPMKLQYTTTYWLKCLKWGKENPLHYCTTHAFVPDVKQRVTTEATRSSDLICADIDTFKRGKIQSDTKEEQN